MEACRNILSPDIVWRAPAANPEGGLDSAVIHGFDEWRQAIENTNAQLDERLRFTPKQIIAEGTMAAVVSHNTASQGDKNFDLEMMFVLSIRDDRVAEFTEYPQSPSMWTTFWLGG